MGNFSCMLIYVRQMLDVTQLFGVLEVALGEMD